MKPSLQLKLNQSLKMTPQLQQAIRLLQLSSPELELEIRNTLESNPLLEPVESEANEELDETEHIHYLISQFQTERNSTLPEYHLDLLLQKNAETTLQQHLLWQMELAHFSDREKMIAIALIDAISEEGYLSCSLSELQQSLEIKAEVTEIETVLCHIQQFEPLGVGARNLAECLNIQLNALPPSTPWIYEAKMLVSTYLESLGKRNYNYLKLRLNLDEEALRSTIKILTSLNPKPGTQISPKKCEYIIPDIIALKKNNHLIIALNKEFMPSLRINSNYATLIKSKNNAENLQTFKTHLKEAKWFLKGIETRNETLLKVARSIIEKQEAFLDFGEEVMKPLNLQDIAKAVNLHESTVSRITTQKYILTPRGVFELKYFFSNSIASSQEKQTSTTAIRALIKKIIAKESSQTPFSDDKLTQLLLKKGINISRRTVTKYREAMRIPTSNKRRT